MKKMLQCQGKQGVTWGVFTQAITSLCDAANQPYLPAHNKKRMLEDRLHLLYIFIFLYNFLLLFISFLCTVGSKWEELNSREKEVERGFEEIESKVRRRF